MKLRTRPSFGSTPPEPLLIPADYGLGDRFTSFAPYQDVTALSIAASEKRFNLLSAPTGAGKSLINVLTGRLSFGRTLYLVSTKALQSQLETDFSSGGMASVLGHSNYPCWPKAHRNGQTEDPTLDPHFKCGYASDNCPQREDLRRCANSDLVVTNYANWIMLGLRDDEPLGTFLTLILDEAHLLPELLCDLYSLEIPVRQLQRIGLTQHLPSDESAALAWLLNAYDHVLASPRINSEQARLIARRLKQCARALESNRAHRKFILLTSKFGRSSVTPIWSAPFNEHKLFRGIPRIVLSSATLDRNIGQYLGFGKSDSAYFGVPSMFNPARRPFIFLPTVRAWHGMTDGEKRVQVQALDKIYETRTVALKRNGLLHTHSYRRANEVLEMSRYADRFTSHGKGAVMEALRLHRESHDGSLLVTPSAEEGLDLPEDLVRYQIIIKIPFADGRDPLTAARIALIPSYNTDKAVQTLQQTYGRGMRRTFDWCETFILDDSWKWFQRNRFASWFKAAWQFPRSLPAPLNPGELPA